jgi:flagella basal body P-ring formation protein FlgA
MTATGRILLLLALLAPGAASAWLVVLPDSLTVATEVVRLGEVSLSPVPAEAAAVLLAEAGEQGGSTIVTRQGVLRRLVALGLADAVQLDGAKRCVIRFGGALIDPSALQVEAERLVGTLLPAAAPGAPATWCEVTLPSGAVAASGPWSLACSRREPLPPGRSQVRLELLDGWQAREVPATVVVHAHGEVAVARVAVERDQPVADTMFDWRWLDLAEVPAGLVSSRLQLAQSSAARTLRAGEQLRATDLKPTPVVRAGDMVELLVQRGSVAVSVGALARQSGSVGQTIPVRNELTGRLVNARVAGPGRVEWRR